jgi:alanine racemase
MTRPAAPFARIDLDAFRHNFAFVRSHLTPATGIIAVVKANAYGHGVDLIAREAERCGAAMIGVARSQEALGLTESGLSRPVLVLGTPAYVLLERTINAGVVHAVSSLEDAEAVSSAAGRLGKRAAVHVKVDTGMTRLGLDPAQAAATIERMARMPHLAVDGIFTHLADAENPNRILSRKQVEAFEGVLERIAAKGIEIPFRHCANSAAILTSPESHYNLVRPGLMLYGYLPDESLAVPSPLRPVLSLHSAIVHLRNVEPGVGVSYGHRYHVPRKTTLATAAIGYGDGYSRLLTGKAEALIGGRRYPVVGTICMDLVVIDLGPDSVCSLGDDVVFLGSQGGEAITAWDLARAIGTIPYEIITGITGRVERVL